MELSIATNVKTGTLIPELTEPSTSETWATRSEITGEITLTTSAVAESVEGQGPLDIALYTANLRR